MLGQSWLQADSYVTCGDWIDSPPGAYPDCSSLMRDAKFGFVPNPPKRASLSTGRTQVQFNWSGLDFVSDTDEWRVVNQGGVNAP
jgi:hypothetical protein